MWSVNILTETTSTALHQAHDAQGIGELAADAHEAGEVGGAARRDVEARLGRPVVSGENYKTLTASAAQPQLLSDGTAPAMRDDKRDGGSEG